MDQVMQQIEKCGKFQICHVTIVQLCRFVTAWTVSVMIFGLYNPGWRCDDTNSTTPMILQGGHKFNGTVFPNLHDESSKAINTTTFSSLIQTQSRIDDGARKPNDSLRTSSSANNEEEKESSYTYSSSCNAITSCAAVKFNPASATIVAEFGLVCDRVWIAYVIVSVLNFGMVFGAVAWGEAGERFGRKVGSYGSCLTMALSCGLAMFFPSWQVYAAFTFFIGFGAVGAVSVSIPLCMEFLDSKWRARLAALPAWNLSVMCFTLVIFIFRDWRYIHLVTGLASGVVCLGYFWVPESLRWLVVHGKTDQAKKITDKIYKMNNLSAPSETLIHHVAVDTERTTEDKSKKYTYLDLFRTRDLRIATIKISIIGVILALVYDTIGLGIQSLPGDFYTNLVIASLIELPSTLSTGVLANSIGRRWTGVLFEGIGLCCCATIVVTLVTMGQCQTRDILVTSMAFICKASGQASLNFMGAYTTELVPTAVRNLTFGFVFTCSRMACMAAPYLLPRDHPSMVACFAVLGAMQLAAVGLFFSLPETKDKRIDDKIRGVEQRQTEVDAKSSEC